MDWTLPTLARRGGEETVQGLSLQIHLLRECVEAGSGYSNRGQDKSPEGGL